MGYRQWPYVWFKRTETALNTYNALKSWHDANENYKDNSEGLRKWKARNGRLVQFVLSVERTIAELDEADNT